MVGRVKETRADFAGAVAGAVAADCIRVADVAVAIGAAVVGLGMCFAVSGSVAVGVACSPSRLLWAGDDLLCKPSIPFPMPARIQMLCLLQGTPA